jgi:2-keto-4-pentenoate hydratase
MARADMQSVVVDAGFRGEALAERISQAVRTGETLHLVPEECPPDLDAAEDVLFRVAAGLGPIKAWKLGASTIASRAAQGFDRAWSAPFVEAEVLSSPATLPAGQDGTLGLECELVFRLGADLPASGRLDSGAVRGLVAAVHAGIEVPGSRYPAIGVYGSPALVADRGACGRLILGDAVREWTPDGLDDMGAKLMVDGAVRCEGSGRDLIEGPFGALCDHLARMRSRGIPQTAGTLISIGSLAGFHKAEAGERAVAIFTHLGADSLAELTVNTPQASRSLEE